MEGSPLHNNSKFRASRGVAMTALVAFCKHWDGRLAVFLGSTGRLRNEVGAALGVWKTSSDTTWAWL